MSTPEHHDSSAVRLQLHNLGYVPLPNRGKIPAIVGWNASGYFCTEISPPKVKGDIAKRLQTWPRRFPGADTTGIRIENGLGVVDIDVDDKAIVEKLFAALQRIAPEVWQRAPVRYGGGEWKLALFVRIDGEDFTWLDSNKYHRPNEPPENYHHVEAFGGRPFRSGKCSRQFAIDGPRSYADDGTVESFYEWAQDTPSLMQVALADLPVLSKLQMLELQDVFETEAEAAGWFQIEEANEGDGESEDVYDINRETIRFDVFHGESQISYADLESMVLVQPDIRVSPTFMPNVTTERPDRCSVFWSQKFDCIVIKDWKTNARHYPIDCNPNPMTMEDFGARLRQTAEKFGWVISTAPPRQFSLDDFNAYLPNHSYVHMTTRELWPMASIDSTLPPMQLFKADGVAVTKADGRTKDKKEKPVFITASRWLDKHKPLEQMTWAPGEGDIIRDKLMSKGGWIKSPRSRGLNLYRPPPLLRGNPRAAGPWVNHIRQLYHQDARHIIAFLAHRVQRPDEKINHALVLGGRPGIGKDTILEPVKHAIGHWNMAEISPKQLMENFNEFGQSVILRISEVRDLGEMSMVEFYNTTKQYCAAPPDVLRVNRKHIDAYYVPNVCGVVMTTNYRTNCLYLEADDRRHYIAWSSTRPEDLSADYLPGLWRWYENGGLSDVAAYLATLDLAMFNPKAAPRKTVTFFDIVDACQLSEGSELADALAKLGDPNAVTLQQVRDVAEHDFRTFLNDRKNRRLLPHRFEQCGYMAVRNDGAKDGLWVVSGVRQVCYGREDLTARDRLIAVQVMIQKDEADRQKRAEQLRRGIRTVEGDEKPGDGPVH